MLRVVHSSPKHQVPGLRDFVRATAGVSHVVCMCVCVRVWVGVRVRLSLSLSLGVRVLWVVEDIEVRVRKEFASIVTQHTLCITLVSVLHAPPVNLPREHSGHICNMLQMRTPLYLFVPLRTPLYLFVPLRTPLYLFVELPRRTLPLSLSSPLSLHKGSSSPLCALLQATLTLHLSTHVEGFSPHPATLLAWVLCFSEKAEHRPVEEALLCPCFHNLAGFLPLCSGVPNPLATREEK